jgi:uncharacterized protein (TIGR02117 family)
MAKTGLLRLLFVCAALLVFADGCARRQPNRLAHAPPPWGTHSVLVVGHRYHTGLAVRAGDVRAAAWPARRHFPGAVHLLLGWGEREYYTHEDPGFALALRALFVPSPSAIEVIPVAAGIAQALPDSEIVELHVGRAGFDRMVEFVRATHEFDASGNAVVIGATADGRGLFYASARPFDALHNCNVWVAHALQAAGLPVRPQAAVTAGLLLRQVRRLAAVPRAGEER